MAKSTFDIATHVTNSIIASLEQGTIPWHKPWTCGRPKNLVTGKDYHGINFMLLSMGKDSSYCTYKQALSIGANVKEGMKGTPVVYYNFIESVKDGKKSTIPFMKYSTVFGVSQLENVPAKYMPIAREIPPLEEVDKLIEKHHPIINHGGSKACYSPSSDEITMPDRNTFDGTGEYYSTLLHEVSHWTGHSTRLNREGITGTINFGSEVYSKEELIAEMSAAFMCTEFGIDNTLKNSTGYIQGWLSKIKGDRKLIIQSASQAGKVFNFLTGKNINTPDEIEA
jgi:antirestriction protein ArdC